MKKQFLLLFFSTLLLVVPLWAQLRSDDSAEQEYYVRSENFDQPNQHDNDVHELTKDDLLQAFIHAQLLLAEHAHQISDNQYAPMNAMLPRIPFVFSHIFGIDNTFVGIESGNFTLTGAQNTGFGKHTLQSDTTGFHNTAVGFNALNSNTAGSDNTAFGYNALDALTTGTNNIAIGSGAGQNAFGASSSNIYVGNDGANENSTIRIGISGTQLRNFQAGIYGVTPAINDALHVIIDSAGQLGTASGCDPFIASSNITTGNPVRLELDLTTNTAVDRALLADPSFKWAVQSISSDDITATVTTTGIVADCSGNIYIVGRLQGTLTFGSILVSSANLTAFIAKLDYDGNWVFVVLPTVNTGVSAAGGIAFDGVNNLYIAGSFQGTLQFDALPVLTTVGVNAETFVLIMDTAGTPLLTQQTVSTGVSSTQSFGITVDCLGNGYLTGTINGDPIMFGASTLTPSSGFAAFDAFIAAIDSAGNWLWANQSVSTPPGTNSTTTPTGITTDCQGNIYIAGYFTTSTTFATTPVTTVTAASNDEAFIAKASAVTGEWLIVVQTFSTGIFVDTRAQAISNDSQGNVYVTGSFIATTQFGPTTLTTPPIPVSLGQTFVSKLNNDLIWQYTVNVPHDPSVASPFNVNNGFGIATDCEGNVFVTGVLRGSAMFGTTTLTNLLENSAYIAKLTSGGVWSGAALQSVGGNAVGNAIASNCQGNVYATGFFTDNVLFGSTLLSSVHPAAGVLVDAWVANVVSDRTVHLIGLAQQTVLSGASNSPIFNGIASGNIYSGLIPSFDYFVDQDGNIVPGCRNTLCCDPSLTYIGTACSTTELILRF